MVEGGFEIPAHALEALVARRGAPPAPGRSRRSEGRPFAPARASYPRPPPPPSRSTGWRRASSYSSAVSSYRLPAQDRQCEHLPRRHRLDGAAKQHAYVEKREIVEEEADVARASNPYHRAPGGLLLRTGIAAKARSKRTVREPERGGRLRNDSSLQHVEERLYLLRLRQRDLLWQRLRLATSIHALSSTSHVSAWNSLPESGLL